MYSLPANICDDIRYYGSTIDEYREGKLEPVKFKAVRVPMGIYEQREDGTYMVRIRCAAGFITPRQLVGVAELADKYGSGLLHITTRQELQIQNVNLDKTLLILQGLNEIGMASKGGGGNTVRNILASVDSGIDDKEQFDVTHYAINLTTKLIAEPDSFTLPRKFKIAFSNSDKDTGFAKFNDLGFIASTKEGKRGFKVFLGGSLGTKPMVGYQIFEFAPESELFLIADAAKKLFSRYGNRKNRHKARLRYVFYKYGADEVLRLYFEIFNELKASSYVAYKHSNPVFDRRTPDTHPVIFATPDFEIWKGRFVKSQNNNGFHSVIVPFTNGNSDSATLAAIARFASQFGDDTIRFSMRQNLHLRNIPGKWLPDLYNLLLALGLEVTRPLVLNTLVACTGADTCRLGICLSKNAAEALRQKLENSGIDLDRLSDLRINISGCPNSCGQQAASDIGFYGKVARNDRMYPAYNVVAGAIFGKNAQLAEIAGEVSAYDLPGFTVEILKNYLSHKENDGTFGNYFQNKGKPLIAGLTQIYSNVPSFRDDKNYYFDWGSDNIFSLSAKGAAECSAGLFDMIEVDLNSIRKHLKLIGDDTFSGNINGVLYETIFAASRMLLITRGSEPKTTADVFDMFLDKFVDTYITGSGYREIVELARDNKNYNFAEKKGVVINLSKEVISLYENMDDSLQFIAFENKNVAQAQKPSQIATKHSDFRGVACPMNFVKTKIELATLNPGDILEILLDDGEPIENVPSSIRGEGHTILEEIKQNGYWKVSIKKSSLKSM